jgi:S1-C subfamily serine protease
MAPPINTHLALVVFIRIVVTGKAPKPSFVGSATGFVFEHNEKRFLVTNRHVVVKEEEEFYPDQLLVRIHSSQDTVEMTREVALQLYDGNGHPVWLEHHDKAIDLAALEIGGLLKDTDMVTCWKSKNLVPQDYRVEVGVPVFIIGYPLGFFDQSHYLPPVRSGFLATTYGLDFNGLPICLIDANLHPGTSGSPVLIVSDEDHTPSVSIQSDLPSFLLGVNAGTYSVSGVSLGLNTVWYSKLLMDIFR